MWLIGLAFLLWMIGLLLWVYAKQKRRRSGLPSGQIRYNDASTWQRNERPFFSSRYRLTEKPDYLVQQGRTWIPVEVKSTRLRGRRPYHAHVMQLAAYCLLIEDLLGVRPSYGILRYEDATVSVNYTEALRDELLATLSAMRRATRARDVPRSHEEPARCRACGFRTECGQALG